MNETEKQISEVHIIAPDPKVFERQNNVIQDTMTNVGQSYYIFDHAEYPDDGGIYVYYKGMPFPRKAWPTPEAVYNNDLMKRTTMTILNIFTGKDLLLPFIAFAILPWKLKMKTLTRAIFNYHRITEWMLMPYYLKPQYYSRPCRTIRKLTHNFLLALGINENLSDIIAKGVATMIEYDDAYRYRIQDLMTTTTLTRLRESPSQEVKKLLATFKERELAGNVMENIKSFSFISSLVLLHPKVRKAWCQAFMSITFQDFEWLQLDEADQYHTLNRGDYNYLGRTLEHRTQIYTAHHTFSKCCGTKVGIHLSPDGSIVDHYECMQCKKPCGTVVLYPPYNTVVE